MRLLHTLLAVPALVLGLLASSHAQVQAYLFDEGSDKLHSVDLITGATTFIASSNGSLKSQQDLTWKSNTQDLWTITEKGWVGTIDTTTGTFSPVFNTNQTWCQGLAWDPQTQRFYITNQTGQSFVLDPTTGQTTLLGAVGYPIVACLDVDASGTLWGIEIQGTLVKINKSTGAGTGTASTIPYFQGLGIDQATGKWYGTTQPAWSQCSLYEIDPKSGAATLISVLGSLGKPQVQGFDLVDNLCTVKYGNGCPGTGGFVPVLDMANCPKPGRKVTLTLSQGLGGAMSALFITPASGVTPIGSSTCTLLVAGNPFTLFIPLSGSGAGKGSYQLPAVIPVMSPVTIYTQAFVNDPAGAIALSVSNGLRIDIK